MSLENSNWNGRDLYVEEYIFANREGRRTNLVKKDRVGALVDIVELGLDPSTHSSRHV